jgi:hypothetical protein
MRLCANRLLDVAPSSKLYDAEYGDESDDDKNYANNHDKHDSRKTSHIWAELDAIKSTLKVSTEFGRLLLNAIASSPIPITIRFSIIIHSSLISLCA